MARNIFTNGLVNAVVNAIQDGVSPNYRPEVIVAEDVTYQLARQQAQLQQAQDAQAQLAKQVQAQHQAIRGLGAGMNALAQGAEQYAEAGADEFARQGKYIRNNAEAIRKDRHRIGQLEQQVADLEARDRQKGELRNKRFAKLEARCQALEQQVQAQAQELAQVKQTQAQHGQQIQEHGQRLDHVEYDVKAANHKIDNGLAAMKAAGFFKK